MSTSPTDPAAVTAAIHTLATLERLDLNPGNRVPGMTNRSDEAWSLLRAAGPAALDEIQAAIPGATGTGHVALVQVIHGIDRERGARLIAAMQDDPREAWVDTCLVGFRSVAQWARMQQPSSVTRAPPAASRTGRTLVVLAIAAALVLVGYLLGR